MTIYVNRNDIKHVDIEKFAAKLRILGGRLTDLAFILEKHETFDMNVFDEDFMDVWCGDATDEMYSLANTFNELIDPYKQGMLDEFLAENTQNGQ